MPQMPGRHLCRIAASTSFLRNDDFNAVTVEVPYSRGNGLTGVCACSRPLQNQVSLALDALQNSLQVAPRVDIQCNMVEARPLGASQHQIAMQHSARPEIHAALVDPDQFHCPVLPVELRDNVDIRDAKSNPIQARKPASCCLALQVNDAS